MGSSSPASQVKSKTTSNAPPAQGRGSPAGGPRGRGNPQRSRLRRPGQGQGSLLGRGRGLQRPDGRLPEVHGGIEGGGGLGCLLLAVATSANIPRRCLHSAVPPVQIFILTLMYLLVPAFAIYMQTISNKYCVLN